MPLPSPVEPRSADPTVYSPALADKKAGQLFGVPLGDLGWFTTLLMSLTSGFAAFFAATFLGIMGLLVYNSATHGNADYAISYKLIGLPVGLVVLLVVSVYLGSLWIRRVLRRA